MEPMLISCVIRSRELKVKMGERLTSTGEAVTNFDNIVSGALTRAFGSQEIRR